MKKWWFCLLLCQSCLSGIAQSTGPAAIGVVSYTYRNSFQKSVPLTLDTIRALGINNVEFSNLFGQTAADIRKWLDERGMYCTSYGTSYDDALAHTREVGEKARTLGARYVRVAWIPHDRQAPFSKTDADRAIADFHTIGRVLKEEFGLAFCYHNHGYEFVPHENGTLFDYLVANTNPLYVNFELDILWAYHPGADPAQLLLRYPDRFLLMHVKDLRKGVAGDFSGTTDPDNDVIVGTGQIDVAGVVSAAKKTSVHFFFIEDESSTASRQVGHSLSFLRNLMK